MEGGQQQQLYIVTVGKRGIYEIHRIDDQPLRSCNVQLPLPPPFFRLNHPPFPQDANFAAIGSRIFIVGGCTENRSGQPVKSDQVFILDPNTKDWVDGPSMISGKLFPFLITIGSKLFALSNLLSYGIDRQPESCPRFEVLDTDDLLSGWTALHLPTSLGVSDGEFSWAATADYIFASMGNSGTWVFNVNNSVWTQATQDGLPFFGYAATLPNIPNLNLCCAYSNRSDRFCVFRFQFDHNSLVIHEFGVDDSHCFPRLSPSLQCCNHSGPVAFNDGRIYFVSGGVDQARSYSYPLGNRYIEVYAQRLNQRQILRRCSHMRSDDDAVKDLQLTNLWSGSFFGGPAFDSFIQVIAAFVVCSTYS